MRIRSSPGWLKRLNGSAWTAITTTITTVLTAIQTVFTTIWTAIQTAITTIINAIATVITNVLNTIKNLFTTVWNGIKNTVTTVLNAIKSTVTSIWNAIVSGISNAMSVAVDMSSVSITGIELLSAEYTGHIGVIASVDNGTTYSDEMTIGAWLHTDVVELWNSLPENRMLLLTFILYEDAHFTRFKITYEN